MPIEDSYSRQVELLVKVLPSAALRDPRSTRGGHCGERARPQAVPVGIEKGEPDWDLLEVPHAKTLPAILWKLHNFAKVSDEKRTHLVAQLEAVLGMSGDPATGQSVGELGSTRPTKARAEGGNMTNTSAPEGASRKPRR